MIAQISAHFCFLFAGQSAHTSKGRPRANLLSCSFFFLSSLARMAPVSSPSTRCMASLISLARSPPGCLILLFPRHAWLFGRRHNRTKPSAASSSHTTATIPVFCTLTCTIPRTATSPRPRSFPDALVPSTVPQTCHGTTHASLHLREDS